MRTLLVCATVAAAAAPALAKRATPAEAKKWAADLDPQLRAVYVKQATSDWINQNFITDDTERASTTATDELLAAQLKAIRESRRFDGLKLDPDTARKIYLLRSTQSLIAPADPALRAEASGLVTKMTGIYGKGKACKGDKCRNMLELENVVETSRDPAQVLDAWEGWHRVGRDERALYTRFVELANQGAKEVGFADTGEMWRSGYDMKPADFAAETERLWGQLKPLYEQLHCYVRARLARKYGAKLVPAGGALPAHLLGNMWGQEWGNIYDLVEPYPGQTQLDVTAAMQRQKWTPDKMAHTAEGFFTSLGLDPLPKTFWERSLFVKPRDREVVCHASAWDVQLADDLRIKMCIEVKERDLTTLHHEMGHDYYYHAYHTLPVLYQQGANDGFHEAIGDALTLSMTPGYLKQLGLVQSVPTDHKGLIDVQMKMGLEKVALAGWTKMIDQWRWDVFSGTVKPDHYNQAWWDLRMKYEGIAPPVPRTEEDFDPGAKYHVPNNTPYVRYFLALILQFQFHRALCRAAGFQGPLYQCSIYGSKEAGKRLQSMLALGASKPWPEALKAISGEEKIDAGAMLEYFAPLAAYLKEANAGQKCGW